LQEEGVATAGDEAVDALAAFAETADAAEVRAVARSLALYALDAPAPVTAAELQALLPATIDGEVDTVVAAVAERRAAAALSAFARVAAQGAGASSVASALGRHFRQIHAVASAPDGPEAAIGRLRPPVYGPRRDALSRAVRAWPPRLSETALEMILETEFTLRSTGGPPDRAVVERLLVRLSTLRPR
jgi:DNA polymerase-3 subunit delta